MRRAIAYIRCGRIFLAPSSQMMGGAWIETEPVYALEEGDPSVLGGRILDALAASKSNLPIPASWKQNNPILALAGVKSWPAFARTAKYVAIQQTDCEVQFTPYRKSGSGNYHQICEKAVTTKAKTPEELAHFLLSTARHCE